jgi:ATPase subunit of ABC transporter with duplicated ATPase domains
LQDKLDREANSLKEKMTEENEKRSKESKELQETLAAEKAAMAQKMESGSKELAEKMAREEELRRKHAEEIKSQMESEKKQQGNAVTEMFDRLKSENETRKTEIHGLKDILVGDNPIEWALVGLSFTRENKLLILLVYRGRACCFRLQNV